MPIAGKKKMKLLTVINCMKKTPVLLKFRLRCSAKEFLT